MKGIEAVLKRTDKKISKEEEQIFAELLGVKEAIPVSMQSWNVSESYIGLLSPWANQMLKEDYLSNLNLRNFLNTKKEQICVCWYKGVGILLC